MKKISKFSIMGMGAGLVFAVGSFVRYFFIYPDIDRSVVYTLVGLLLFGLSWIYNSELNKDHRISAIEEYLADKEKEDEKKDNEE